MTRTERRRILVLCVTTWLAWATLVAFLSATPGCAHWQVDHPTCGLRRGSAEVSWCCEAGISGELDAGVVSLDVTGLVEGCARVRVVAPEPEEPRARR